MQRLLKKRRGKVPGQPHGEILLRPTRLGLLPEPGQLVPNIELVAGWRSSRIPARRRGNQLCPRVAVGGNAPVDALIRPGWAPWACSSAWYSLCRVQAANGSSAAELPMLYRTRSVLVASELGITHRKPARRQEQFLRAGGDDDRQIAACQIIWSADAFLWPVPHDCGVAKYSDWRHAPPRARFIRRRPSRLARWRQHRPFFGGVAGPHARTDRVRAERKSRRQAPGPAPRLGCAMSATAPCPGPTLSRTWHWE